MGWNWCLDVLGLTVNIRRLSCLSSYFRCNIATAEGDNSCCKLNSANSLFYSVIPPVTLALFCFRCAGTSPLEI